MEFADVVRGRRMVRRFLPDPIDPGTLDRIVRLGLRAPSAGFSQGWDFVVLTDPADVQRYWSATTELDAADGGVTDRVSDRSDDRWLTGLRSAPALVLCCSDKQTYLRRYAEPDKPWQDRDEAHWPVPYWDVDTGMAAMIMLLAATDEGLGALFFGIPEGRDTLVQKAFGIPTDRRTVGVIALGRPAETSPSGSTRTRRRRPVGEVVHAGRFGRSWAAADASSSRITQR